MTSIPARPSAAPAFSGLTEFDILKAKHRFLRDDNEASTSWDDALARKYYDSLWKEYALCDLKHYKSGEFALRWRTEEEVIEGAGEDACANVRCRYALPVAATSSSKRKHKKHRGASNVRITALQLPFGYVEEGKQKSALVKVVLCDKCVKKIMWKREADKKRLREAEDKRGTVEDRFELAGPPEAEIAQSDSEGGTDEERERGEKRYRRKRSSRSRSPRRRGSEPNLRRRRSP